MTSKELKKRLSQTPNRYKLYVFLELEVEELIKDLEILEEIKKNHPDLYNLYKKMKEAESEWLEK